MRATVQQLPRIREVETAVHPLRIHHWSDAIWHEKSLDPQIETRLSRVDRALQAVAGLHRILVQDERNAEWSIGTRERGENGLLDSEIESLHSALELLIGQAAGDMEVLRERCDDQWDGVAQRLRGRP